jgi:hypothetical protein
MAESVSSQSLRNVFTGVFAYYLLTSLVLSKFSLTKKSFVYILFLIFYTFCFYAFGSANNLIIHLLTICLGTVLFYNALLASQYDVNKVWAFAKKIWYVIYATLVIEVILVFLGYQELLYFIFPEINREQGLPAYRSLVNTFADYFDLGFDGLNSITLQAQAYGQFSVMLSILGFSYTQSPLQNKNWVKLLMLAAIPAILFSISPNITSSIMLAFIVAYVFYIKFHLHIYSFGKFIGILSVISACFFLYYLGDFGFVRTYSSSELYDLFANQQIDYVLTRSFSDYIIGVGLDEYNDIAPTFEIAFLSYLSISGLIFGLVNLVILLNFTISTLKQVKIYYQKKLVEMETIEIQIMNLLFVLAMLLSSIHFPVITNYLGSMVFIFHLSFGLYILKVNRDHVRDPSYPPNLALSSSS